MSECYLGEIRMFAGTYAPRQWSFCDGSLLAIQDYQALFTLIGTSYGGDGVRNFALPDLRGRIAMGQGNGPSLTPRALGQSLGTETETLATVNLPAHNHSFVASLNPATVATPAGNVLATTVTTPKNFSLYTISPPPTPTPSTVTLAKGSIQPSGGGGGHDNMMAGLCINFIIALFGIFPTRN